MIMVHNYGRRDIYGANHFEKPAQELSERSCTNSSVRKF